MKKESKEVKKEEIKEPFAFTRIACSYCGKFRHELLGITPLGILLTLCLNCGGVGFLKKENLTFPTVEPIKIKKRDKPSMVG